MKPKLFIYSQPNYLPRTAIVREQKQFIKIAFAVHLSAAISAERYRSDSGALKSAVPVFVYFYIIMIVHKYRQSAKIKILLNNPTDRTFGNRRSIYKEPSKNKAEAYRVYVEHLFLRSDAGDARIFSKEETGLYYYGARYLDPKYLRWLSGEPALNDYIPKAPIDDEAKKHNENLPGMGGVFNVVNLHVYHYAGNNPVKYVDPTGMWINNEDGTYTAEKEDTLYGLYGDDWKEKSGFTRDPRTLQVGEIVEKKIILENKKAAITYNDDGIDPNGYTEIFTTKFDWVIKPHGKINLAEADIFYKHRNGVSPNTIVAITGIKIKNIRNFYGRKGRYISSEINYEEIFLLPGEASSK